MPDQEFNFTSTTDFFKSIASQKLSAAEIDKLYYQFRLFRDLKNENDVEQQIIQSGDVISQQIIVNQ